MMTVFKDVLVLLLFATPLLRSASLSDETVKTISVGESKCRDWRPRWCKKASLKQPKRFEKNCGKIGRKPGKICCKTCEDLRAKTGRTVPKDFEVSQSLPSSRPKWRNMKPKKDGVLTLTWKVNYESLSSHRVNPEKLTQWVSSIMCMIMSVTRVNLVEAASLDTAEIPISFLEQADYRKLSDKNSIAFSDIEEMTISGRTPIYINTYPEGSTWSSMDGDRLVFEKTLIVRFENLFFRNLSKKHIKR